VYTVPVNDVITLCW